MIILGSCNTRALFVLFTEETIASNREVISFLAPSSTMHCGCLLYTSDAADE